MMKSVRRILRELLGLVVDDWRLAIAIVVWLAIVWLGLPRLGVEGLGRAVFLFAGLALILAESPCRRAWRQKRGVTTE